MAYCSFVVWTPVEIQVRERRLLLDPGMNAFVVEVADVNAFASGLVEFGARIIQCNVLDAFDPVPVDPDILAAGALPSLSSGDT